MVRLNSNGAIDPSFGSNGGRLYDSCAPVGIVNETENTAGAVVIPSDGEIPGGCGLQLRLAS